MTVLTLDESKRARTNTSAHPSNGTESVGPTSEQVFVGKIRAELDGYFVDVKRFQSMQPDEVMLYLSGLTARLSEIRMQLCRNDSRRLVSLRTREVDPLLEECDRQFRFHSRLQAIRQMDWDVSARGQT